MEPLKAHTNSVVHVIFGKDADLLVSAGLDKAIIVWDLGDKCNPKVRHMIKTHTRYVDRISLSPDDSFVVSGSAGNLMQMWDVTTGQQVRVVMGISPPVIDSIVWSRDGQRIESVVSEGQMVPVRNVDIKVRVPL